MSIGNLKEQARFRQEYPIFLKYHDALEATTDKFFERDIKRATKADRVVFGLGISCAEDFQQVFILCSNGFGIGAMQILRGMYERQVTAAYLSKFPDEAQNFIDYHYVHRRKGMILLKDMFGAERAKTIIPPNEQEQIEAAYQLVKDKFIQTACETCQTTRPMLSWTKHSIQSLAQKGDQDLAQTLYVNYYLPTLVTHSTLASLISRLVQDDDGTLAYAVEGQRNQITEALLSAHTLLLNVLDLQDKHFKLGLNDEISQRFDEYNECWAHLKRTH